MVCSLKDRDLQLTTHMLQELARFRLAMAVETVKTRRFALCVWSLWRMRELTELPP